MTDIFEPHKTVITADAMSKIEGNPKLELNLEDPKGNGLVNTTKIRKINEIIELFSQLKKILSKIQSELTKTNIEERKKMKKIFFENWNILFKPHEDQFN